MVVKEPPGQKKEKGISPLTHIIPRTRKKEQILVMLRRTGMIEEGFSLLAEIVDSKCGK